MIFPFVKFNVFEPLVQVFLAFARHSQVCLVRQIFIQLFLFGATVAPNSERKPKELPDTSKSTFTMKHNLLHLSLLGISPWFWSLQENQRIPLLVQALCMTCLGEI